MVGMNPAAAEKSDVEKRMMLVGWFEIGIGSESMLE
jgi:hypothetical protein